MKRRPTTKLTTAPLLLATYSALLGPSSLPSCRAFYPSSQHPNNPAFVVEGSIDRDAPIRRTQHRRRHRRGLSHSGLDPVHRHARADSRRRDGPIQPGAARGTSLRDNDAGSAADAPPTGLEEERHGQLLDLLPWIPAEDVGTAASASGYDGSDDDATRFRDEMVDVALYSGAKEEESAERRTTRRRPACSYLRLRPEAAAQYAASLPSPARNGAESNTASHEMIRRAEYAFEATLRWCSDFVSHLGLCPWAKLSLTTRGAIRIKVVPQDLGIEAFEGAVRDASEELLRVTGGVGYGCGSGEGEGDEPEPLPGGAEFVDPNVAVTFVVAPPPALASADASQEYLDDTAAASSTDYQNLYDFEFVPFHELACDLEDRFFEESLEVECDGRTLVVRGESRGGSGSTGGADEDEDEDDDDENEMTQCIGDWITIAPFHPEWRFASGDEGEDECDDDDDSVAWEKRTPFPTVSLVRTDAIEAAGEEATMRIGMHNEEVLNGLGYRVLREMFRERVLRPR